MPVASNSGDSTSPPAALPPALQALVAERPLVVAVLAFAEAQLRLRLAASVVKTFVSKVRLLVIG